MTFARISFDLPRKKICDNRIFLLRAARTPDMQCFPSREKCARRPKSALERLFCARGNQLSQRQIHGTLNAQVEGPS